VPCEKDEVHSLVLTDKHLAPGMAVELESSWELSFVKRDEILIVVFCMTNPTESSERTYSPTLDMEALLTGK
jgi:hypothetical protein